MFRRNNDKNGSGQERTDKQDNISYSPGAYTEEALEFLKDHMDGDTFKLVMNRQEGKAIPSVLARIYLSESDWKKYIWIEQHGSLKGYKD